MGAERGDVARYEVGEVPETIQSGGGDERTRREAKSVVGGPRRGRAAERGERDAKRVTRREG